MFARLRVTPQGLLGCPIHMEQPRDTRVADCMGPEYPWYLVKTAADFDPTLERDHVLVVCVEAIREWFDCHLGSWPDAAERTLFVRADQVADLPRGPVERISTRFHLLALDENFR